MELANDSDAKVRFYVFKDLQKLNSKQLVSVIRKNKMDTSVIQPQSGYIVSSQTVIFYMLFSISPVELVSFSDSVGRYILGLKSQMY